MFSKAKRFNYPKPEETSPCCDRHTQHEVSFASSSFKRNSLNKSLNQSSCKKSMIPLPKSRRKSTPNLIRSTSERDIHDNSLYECIVRIQQRSKKNKHIATEASSQRTESCCTSIDLSVSDFSHVRKSKNSYLKFRQPVPDHVSNTNLEYRQAKPGTSQDSDSNEYECIEDNNAQVSRRLNFESSDEGFQSSRTPSPPSQPLEHQEEKQEAKNLGCVIQKLLEMYDKKAHPEDYQQLVTFLAELKKDVDKKSTGCMKKFFWRFAKFVSFKTN